MKPTRLWLLLAVSAGGAFTSCGQSADVGPAPQAPSAVVAPLSTVDCAEQASTGYVHGESFPITVVRVDGKPVELDTANAYLVMAQAAESDGVQLRIVSGFRTYAQQAYLYGCYVNCNCNNCNLAASPGYSNHQSGHALDLNTGAPGVLAWLNTHGATYGFTRTVPSESWHWEWWGGGPGGGVCDQPAQCSDDCRTDADDRVAVSGAPAGFGYAIANASGGVSSFGALVPHGDLAGQWLAQPIAGVVVTQSALGYWLVARDGGVFNFGDAGFFGSMGGQPLNAPVVGMAVTPSGQGYWLVGADGGVFAFGDAGDHGSVGGQPLNASMVALAATPSGQGYWLVGADGGVFAFGDAGFHGAMGGQALNSPVVGVATTPSGQGYWLVGADGGIFAFGDAGFHGSMGGQALNAPVIGIATTPSGQGYWLVASDGGVFAFGDAPFLGSALVSRRCDGATTQVCAPGDDGCYHWQVETTCADGCRNGVCAPAGCVDACSQGEERCDGGGVSECGQVDADPCRDWGPPSPCEAGKTCLAGACVTPCEDACGEATVRCEAGGTSTCAVAADGCLAWTAVVPCPSGTHCDGGACLQAVDPDVVEPDPDVVEPDPDTVEPDPDVVEPDPDAVEPDPDAVEPDPDAAVVDAAIGVDSGASEEVDGGDIEAADAARPDIGPEADGAERDGAA
ncbi:MAG: hypothetical protein CVT68_10160, partial [Actinobacteria bacterium HGW-Actinobacteria-8]